MAFNVGDTVRLQKWVSVPPGTSKTGKVLSVEPFRGVERTYSVQLSNGVTASGLWESDLFPVQLASVINP